MFDIQHAGGGSPEDMIQIVASLLEPLSKACAERLSHETDQTRCASKISKNDLRDVRDAFKAILQVKDAENDAFERENCEESWYAVVPFTFRLIWSSDVYWPQFYAGVTEFSYFCELGQLTNQPHCKQSKFKAYLRKAAISNFLLCIVPTVYVRSADCEATYLRAYLHTKS